MCGVVPSSYCNFSDFSLFALASLYAAASSLTFLSAALTASCFASASMLSFLIKASAYLSTSSFFASLFLFAGIALGTTFFFNMVGSSGSGSPKTFAFFHSKSFFFSALTAAFLSALNLATAAFLAAIFYFLIKAFYFA